MSCPSFDTLIDHADGVLEGPAAAVAAHVADCETCREVVSWHTDMVETARGDHSVEPPEWLTRRAIAMFAGQRAGKWPRRALARLTALLVYDSHCTQTSYAPAASRGAVAQSRQLLYNAGQFDLDIMVTAGSGRGLDLAGQVLARDSVAHGFTITLTSSEGSASTASTDQFGAFAFSGLEPGVYVAVLAAADTEITVAQLLVCLE